MKPLNTRTSIALVLGIGMCASAHAGDLVIKVTDEEGLHMSNVVIEVVTPRQPIPEGWPHSGVVDQIDKEFVNPVVTIVENSTVSFPNSDDIHHHVYSFSDTKRFELPLYTGNTAQPVLFDKAGIVTIGCNIHDWMVGYIYVGQSHLMAITDAQGTATLTGLPEGSYTLSLWHNGLRQGQPLPETSVTVAAQGTTEHPVSLESRALQPLRRAPLPGLRNY